MEDEKLSELRQQWEHGLTVNCEWKRPDKLLVVLTKPPPSLDEPTLGPSVPEEVEYHCHRYFQKGDGWAVSVDGQSVPLEAVRAWLMNPCASATQPPYAPISGGKDRL